ncbi:MAG: hypothetical protein ACJAYK_002519 [Crocinitomicaceae bacterium]|jgi:hypothetical protein
MYTGIISIVSVFLLSVFTLNIQALEVGSYFSSKISSPAINFNADSSHWSSNSRGDYAYGDARVGSWFSVGGNITLGVEQRLTHYLTFTAETAEFYGALESNEVPVGIYPLSLRINSAKSNALFVKYQFYPVDDLSVEISAYFLKGLSSQQAVISGLGKVLLNPTNSESAYSYKYELDYLYGRNKLINTVFGPPPVSAKGYGHSFDLEMEYIINISLSAKLTFQDVFNRIHWSQVNYDNGCIARPSACSLRETEARSDTQSLPYSLTAALSHALDYGSQETSAHIEFVKLARHESIWLGLNSWGLGGYVDTLNETFKLSYESERLAVKWAFDDVNYNRANHWQITLGASWPVL